MVLLSYILHDYGDTISHQTERALVVETEDSKILLVACLIVACLTILTDQHQAAVFKPDQIEGRLKELHHLRYSDYSPTPDLRHTSFGSWQSAPRNRIVCEAPINPIPARYPTAPPCNVARINSTAVAAASSAMGAALF